VPVCANATFFNISKGYRDADVMFNLYYLLVDSRKEAMLCLSLLVEEL